MLADTFGYFLLTASDKKTRKTGKPKVQDKNKPQSSCQM